MKFKLRGLIAVPVTPFLLDGGLNLSSVEQHAAELERAGFPERKKEA